MSKVTNHFHIAGNYIAEQHIDIHDNHNCKIYATSAPDQKEDEEPQNGSAESILGIPPEGKYTKVREYITERCRFDEEFKTFAKERTLRELCTRLTKEFGWFVDEHSLGANINRNR
jgi:hypothetical protein